MILDRRHLDGPGASKPVVSTVEPMLVAHWASPTFFVLADYQSALRRADRVDGEPGLGCAVALTLAFLVQARTEPGPSLIVEGYIKILVFDFRRCVRLLLGRGG